MQTIFVVVIWKLSCTWECLYDWVKKLESVNESTEDGTRRSMVADCTV